MARGSDQATGAATSAQKLSNTYSGNASSLFGPVSGMMLSEAANPSGINPTDMARMDAASLETAGGSNAGAAGMGALRAARTRNAGGSDAAIASSARTGGEIASRGILGNRVRDVELKDQNRRAATSGLNSLFAENMGGGNAALGEVANNVNANTQAENASWDWAKDLFTPLMTSAMSGAAKFIPHS